MKVTREIPGGYKLFNAVLFLIIGLMFLVIPSMSMDSLTNGKQRNFIPACNYKFQKEILKTEQICQNFKNINLDRFCRKYLLTILYDESLQNQKTVIPAKELPGKQVKIESTAIEEIGVEMEEILLKHQNSIIKEGNNIMSHPDFQLQKW